MRQRHLFAVCIILILGTLLGCGQKQPTPAGPPPASVGNGSDPDAGVDVSRSTSAAYIKFFSDTVNQHSYGRWTTTNTNGYKAWGLSNTCYNSPKAWVIGQNYWNREDDTLKSNAFTVPASTSGVRLAFYSRWSIGSADVGEVQYRIDGGGWTTVTAFNNGFSPGFPSWYKYYFELPDNGTVSDQSWELRFHFTSDTSGTDWGFGVDSVSVYQRQLEIPQNVEGSDSDGSTTVSWDASTDPLVPDEYWVYRAETEFGTYELVDTEADPANDTQSDNVSDNQCPATNWYKVRSYKAGWPLSDFSAADEGCWNL